MRPKESEFLEMEKRCNLHKTTVASLIKPCPTPKDLGFTCDENDIEQYEKLLRSIKNYYEDNFAFVIIIVMIFVWIGGVYLMGTILGENIFFKYILGTGFIILWSYFLFEFCNYLIEKLCRLAAKRKFNYLNKKELLGEKGRKYLGHSFPYEKITKEKISQIEEYISFKEEYNYIIFKAELIVKRNLKDTL